MLNKGRLQPERRRLYVTRNGSNRLRLSEVRPRGSLRHDKVKRSCDKIWMQQTDDLTDEDYSTLAEFRHQLRMFLGFSSDHARRAGLQPAQHQALLAIRGSPDRELSVGELSRTMLLKAHSASELAKRLVEAGLVERAGTHDGRQRLLRITPKGLSCLAHLSRVHRDELRRVRPLLTDLLGRLERRPG